jgi:hypothetical protein
MAKGVARVGKDIASGAILKTGSTTVFVNDTNVAFQTSINSRGSVLMAPSTVVFVNDKGIGRATDGMSDGGLVTTASTNVYAGK